MTELFTKPIAEIIIILLAFTACLSVLIFLFSRLIRSIKIGFGKNIIQLGSEKQEELINKISEIDTERDKIVVWLNKKDERTTKRIMSYFDVVAERALSKLKDSYIELKTMKLKAKGYNNGKLSKALNNLETKHYNQTQDMQTEKMRNAARPVLCKTDLLKLSTEKNTDGYSEFSLYVEKHKLRWLEVMQDYFENQCHEFKCPSYKQIMDNYNKLHKKHIAEAIDEMFNCARSIHLDEQKLFSQEEQRAVELGKEKYRILLYNK